MRPFTTGDDSPYSAQVVVLWRARVFVSRRDPLRATHHGPHSLADWEKKTEIPQFDQQELPQVFC